MMPRNATYVQAVQVFEPEAHSIYSIEAAEHLTQLPRRTILIYCKHGLVSPASDADWDGFWFDDEAIRRLRNIERLRARCGVNLAGIRLFLDLIREVQELRAQMPREPAQTDIRQRAKRAATNRLSVKKEMSQKDGAKNITLE
jgi:DNA-binding transcriptional MerR regulator